MFKFRINTYPLNEEKMGFKTAKHMIFAHGFTMHDRNFPLVEVLKSKGLILGEKENSASLFITISFSYEEDALNLAQAIQKLNSLINAPTQAWAFSYGVPSLQLLLAGLRGLGIRRLPYFNQTTTGSKADSETIATQPQEIYNFYPYQYFASFLASNNREEFLNNRAPLTAWKHICCVVAFHGSIMPVSNMGIPPQIAQTTEESWSRKSLPQFGRLMGLPASELALIEQRLEKVKETTIANQKNTLNQMIEEMPTLAKLAEVPELKEKWITLFAGEKDRIYPLANMKREAEFYNMELKVHQGPHYIDPQTMWEYITSTLCSNIK